ncbi:hypothetical protein, partial [Streptomyces anulatus]|uniref:hypothetical protein n=1 Tax=Streptomyces anulatus TaxID=1892 RepID=UPI0036C44CF6
MFAVFVLTAREHEREASLRAISEPAHGAFTHIGGDFVEAVQDGQDPPRPQEDQGNRHRWGTRHR